mmetsp:Transcript_14009/g.20993  ORF Transcript_14009/g.20993 Transcript_14009/m.20993 type:complete len:172 (-) Transcript_14009:213-728(-)
MKTSIALIASLATASAFAPTGTLPCSRTSSSTLSATRRESIEQLFGSTAAATAALVLTAAQPAAAATSKAEEAEFNELIEVLKARSEENSEANKNYAMRANKLAKQDFDDVKTRRPKLIIVSTTKGNKILTKEEFSTYNMDGKIDTVYGTRMKQGGGEMKDYNDITYVLKE